MSSIYTGQARYIDGIPVVPTTAARNSRYASPPPNFRVYNLETDAWELWDGTTWGGMPLGGTSVLATGATVARSLGDRFADAPGIDEFGGDKTGATDSSAAVALAIASGFHVLRVNGTYKLAPSSPIALPFGFKFIGDGYGLSKLTKATTGNVFTVEAAGVEFRNLGFDADVGTNTAFGTTGVMIAYTGGAFTAAEGRIINCYSANVDTVIQFGPDGGSRHQVIGGYWLPYTTTAGSEGKTYRTGFGGPDTGARFRSITALTTDGQIDQTGSVDSEMQGVACRRVISTSTTSLLGVQGGIWGSLGQPVTIDGSDIRIMGIRVAGNITLAATMGGSCCFIGNTQTSGTFTDSSPAGVCLVNHHPLTAGYANVNKFTLSQSVNPEEIQSSRPSTDIGNASTTLTADQSPRCIRFNTAISADRDVTLPVPATCRDGMRYRIVRMAGATGAFNVNVKTSGATLLKALATVSNWTEVEYSASLVQFFVCGGGTI